MKIDGAKLTLFCAALLPGLLSPPAFAQADFSGQWEALYHEDAPERLPGPELGDYLGMPINEAARLRADSYDADRISVVTEYQCRPHSSDYSMHGLSSLRIWNEYDPATQKLLAVHTHTSYFGMERTIWMDGRPHPPDYALHTFQGFSTGKWEGTMLTIYTTHLKPSYTKRNGIPSSDKRTISEHWTIHGDYLSVSVVDDDPVFLAEPLIRSASWQRDPDQHIIPYFCETLPEVPLPEGTVPHHLPGTNKFLTEVADWYGLPAEATRGGPETMYPEYRLKMGQPNSPPPQHCERYCNCYAGGNQCVVREGKK